MVVRMNSKFLLSLTMELERNDIRKVSETYHDNARPHVAKMAILHNHLITHLVTHFFTDEVET